MNLTFSNNRVMSLEESIKDVEIKSNRKVAEEEKKIKDLMARLEQEKTEKVDFLEQRLQLLEVENQLLKAENPKLKLECDRLRVQKKKKEKKKKTPKNHKLFLYPLIISVTDFVTEIHCIVLVYEKVEAEEKLTEIEANYDILLKDHEDLKLKYDKERTSTGQLLDELGKELGDLRQYKIETDSIRTRNGSQGELPGRYHSLQLEFNQLSKAGSGRDTTFFYKLKFISLPYPEIYIA
ncbi:LOW QUALITY PROTEIN: hypothetical protein KUTeg_004049 [Tegillarca granosa]|uniref:Rab11-FIP3/4 domain-containing protein n=1 Tax=Tegillarca granosa TaxID=220873 RepID=A0ABQ9FTD1_TEGGR|nr:LOW QUALITY PROTEIN: hypothetical protein KUTeg_004049 [Tegillarca granosa]